MKKTLVRILSGILLLTFTFGGLCACSDKSLLDPNDPVTLTIWHVYGEQADAPMNLLAVSPILSHLLPVFYFYL